jgi:hypothetical protein
MCKLVYVYIGTKDMLAYQILFSRARKFQKCANYFIIYIVTFPSTYPLTLTYRLSLHLGLYIPSQNLLSNSSCSSSSRLIVSIACPSQFPHLSQGRGASTQPLNSSIPQKFVGVIQVSTARYRVSMSRHEHSWP